MLRHLELAAPSSSTIAAIAARTSQLHAAYSRFIVEGLAEGRAAHFFGRSPRAKGRRLFA